MANKTHAKKAEQDQPTEGVCLTEEQFEQLRTKIEEITAQRDDYLATAQRLQAEFDNFRKRTAAVRVESCEEGARDVVKELLPVVDSLERASGGADPDDPYAKGMQQVRKQMMDTLVKMGLEEIDAGGAFNPDLHDALMQVEAESLQPGDIAEVLQSGYLFKGKPIRYTMVKVAK